MQMLALEIAICALEEQLSAQNASCFRSLAILLSTIRWLEPGGFVCLQPTTSVSVLAVKKTPISHIVPVTRSWSLTLETNPPESLEERYRADITGNFCTLPLFWYIVDDDDSWRHVAMASGFAMRRFSAS